MNASDSESLTMIIFIVMAAVFLILVVALLINALICYLLYKDLEEVPPAYRKFTSGQVWLLMIPLFNIYWNFVVFRGISDSFKAFFDAQQVTDVEDCGRKLGMWTAICIAVGTVAGFIPIVGCVLGMASMAGLVLLIMYLVQLNGLKHRVAEWKSANQPDPLMPAINEARSDMNEADPTA